MTETEKPNKPTVPFAAASVEPPLKPHEAAEPGEKTVTMTFPHKVNLTTQNGRVVTFQPGVQEVPESLANHTYLQHSGVKRHDQAKKSNWQEAAEKNLAKRTPAQMTERHVDFLRSRGYHVADAAAAQTFYDNLQAQDQPGFLQEASEFATSDQYTLQRRVQDDAAGFEHAAPPNPKQGEAAGGPEPASVGDLVDEGSARSVVEEQKNATPASQTQTQVPAPVVTKPAAGSTNAPKVATGSNKPAGPGKPEGK